MHHVVRALSPQVIVLVRDYVRAITPETPDAYILEARWVAYLPDLLCNHAAGDEVGLLCNHVVTSYATTLQVRKVNPYATMLQVRKMTPYATTLQVRRWPLMQPRCR